MAKGAWNKGLTQFPTPESFLSKTLTVSGCLIWQGKCNAKGYGRSFYKGEDKAHRISWMLFKGAISQGMHVLHKCDIPACVNPEHLYLGNNKDNVEDKVDRGRLVLPCNKGERNGQAILTEQQVAEIRKAARGMITSLSIKLGISRRTAYAIRANQRWK